MDDEKYYQIVADEIRSGRINDAVWTKAIAKSMGDENKTKAVYIQLRVEQLMQEETRSKIEEKLGDSAGTGSDYDSEESTPDKEEDERMIAFGKYVAAGILVIVIVFVVKNVLWPKLRTYF